MDLYSVVIAALLALLSVGAAEAKPDGDDDARKYGARETAALVDMNTMRDAEVVAFLDTDYLHTLENLNDLMGFDPMWNFDDINENGLGTQVIDIRTGRFHFNRLDLTRPPRVWGGPYVNFQQGRFSIDGAGYDPGTPIDPWGNPYYLFTPLGLVRPTLGTVTLELYGDQFDRYAIVSLANDGVKSGDDLIVYFGGGVFGPPRVTTISSLVPAVASRSSTVRVRGYNFGAAQDDSRLELDGLAIDSIRSWNDREITFQVPNWADDGNVVVVRSFTQSNPFPLQIIMAAARWTLYR